jgi:hypothetical protein
MRDVGILEAAQHLKHGIDLADRTQELVAEALALGGAAHQTRNVLDLELGGHGLRGLGQPAQRVEPWIGYRHAAHIGLDRAKGIVRRRRGLAVGHRVEEGRLADVRKADDAAIEAHAGSWRRPRRTGALWRHPGAETIGCGTVSTLGSSGGGFTPGYVRIPLRRQAPSATIQRTLGRYSTQGVYRPMSVLPPVRQSPGGRKGWGVQERPPMPIGRKRPHAESSLGNLHPAAGPGRPSDHHR